MSYSRLFTEQQLREPLRVAEEIGSSLWRYGRRVTYVFEADGSHWRTTVEEVDGAIQLDGDQICTCVRHVPKTVMVWEDVE